MTDDRKIKITAATENMKDTAEVGIQTAWPTINRNYKASLFAMLFSDREKLLELYNAINGTHYEDPEKLEVVTLENAIYMGIKNDVSCIVDCRLSLYEHQASWNPNMPLRFLEYVADQYSGMIKRELIYGTRRIHIPAPRFVVFYNGKARQPERQVLRLSDMYKPQDDNPRLELEAFVLNINKGCNRELMEACRTLSDYAEYVARVRKYEDDFGLDIAVERAVSECIEEGILADFLKKNRAGVIKVSLYEFDMEKFLEIERENVFEDGLEQGIEQGIELVKGVLRDHAAGMPVSEIAKHRNTTEKRVLQIIG